MSKYTQLISAHYDSRVLKARIAAIMKQAGIAPHQLTRDHLKALDEFHTRGRSATRMMAESLGIKSGTSVLDIGSGIGGPARTLAAEFECNVIGIDAVSDYCTTAAWLTDLLGLSQDVRFAVADAADLPFTANSFKIVWSQHVVVNIWNKDRFAGEIHRVLRAHGKYVFFEVCADAALPYFPVPWASDGNIHFPINEDEFRVLFSGGFHMVEWQDVTEESLEWFRKLAAHRSAQPGIHEPALDLQLLMGPTIAEKMSNMVRNMEERRIRLVQGVMERTE